MENGEKIYERITALCKQKGISVNKLTQIIGISKNLKSLIVDGNPSIEKFINIAKCFNVSLDYLLCRTNEIPSKNDKYVSLPQDYNMEAFKKRIADVLINKKREEEVEYWNSLSNSIDYSQLVRVAEKCDVSLYYLLTGEVAHNKAKLEKICKLADEKYENNYLNIATEIGASLFELEAMLNAFNLDDRIVWQICNALHIPQATDTELKNTMEEHKKELGNLSSQYIVVRKSEYIEKQFKISNLSELLNIKTRENMGQEAQIINEIEDKSAMATVKNEI